MFNFEKMNQLKMKNSKSTLFEFFSWNLQFYNFERYKPMIKNFSKLFETVPVMR